MRVRFHGGPADGKVMELPDETPSWDIPVLPDPQLAINGPADQGPAFQVVRYERMLRRRAGTTNVLELDVPFVVAK